MGGPCSLHQPQAATILLAATPALRLGHIPPSTKTATTGTDLGELGTREEEVLAQEGAAREGNGEESREEGRG